MRSPKRRMVAASASGNDDEVAGQGEPLGHRLALAVAEGRRVVHVVLEHAGVRRAQDGQGHLVGDREQRVLEQLEGDGVARPALIDELLPGPPRRPRSMTMLPRGRGSARAPAATTQVASYSSTMQRAAAAAGEIAAAQDGGLEPAVLRPEVHAARRAAVRPSGPRSTLDALGHARAVGDALGDHAQADQLDGLVGPGAMPVGALVLAAEGLRDAGDAPAASSAPRARGRSARRTGPGSAGRPSAGAARAAPRKPSARAGPGLLLHPRPRAARARRGRTSRSRRRYVRT